MPNGMPREHDARLRLGEDAAPGCRLALPARDLGGDQVLQAPEVAVADAVLLEVRDRLVEVVGAGAAVAAGAREAPGGLLGGQAIGGEWRRTAPAQKTSAATGPLSVATVIQRSIERECRNGTSRRMRVGQSRRARSASGSRISSPAQRPPGASAIISPGRSGVPRKRSMLDGEGAVPARRGAAPDDVGLEHRLPDQRAVGEDPDRLPVAFRQQAVGEGGGLVVGRVSEMRWRRQLRLDAEGAGDELRRQRHAPAHGSRGRCGGLRHGGGLRSGLR